MEFIFLSSNTVKRWKVPPGGGDGLTGGDSEGCPVLSRVQSVTRELTEGSLASWEQDVVARTPREELPRTRETTRRIPRTRPVLNNFILFWICQLICGRLWIEEISWWAIFCFLFGNGWKLFFKKNDAASNVKKQLVCSALLCSGRVEPDVHDRPLCKGLTESPSPITFLDCGLLLLGSNQSARNSFLSVLLFCFFFCFLVLFFCFLGPELFWISVSVSLERDVLATVEISGDEPNSRSCRRTQEIDGSANCTVIRDAQNPCRELS